MRTIITLSEFNDMVGEIAKKADRTYWAVDARIQNGILEFRGYIDGYNYHTHSTPQAVCRALQEQIFGKTEEPKIEVEIEHENIEHFTV